MGEHAGAVRVREYLQDLAERGPDVLPNYFSEDVIWHIGDKRSRSGDYRGVTQLMDYFRDFGSPTSAKFPSKSASILAGDHHAALILEVSFQANNLQIDLSLSHAFKTGPDGRWTEYWEFPPAGPGAVWWIEPVLSQWLKSHTSTNEKDVNDFKPTRNHQLRVRAERGIRGLLDREHGSRVTFPATRKEIKSSDFFNERWYYSIELVPGLFTAGQGYTNVGLTRHLLKRCEVGDRRCLDIGTVEAAIPVLLHRRGARSIVAVDGVECYTRIDAVKHYAGAQFSYYGELSHQRTVPFLKRWNSVNFDVVVLSGVLYHCFGPLHALAMARSLVRTGGLMIIETLAAVDQQQAMFFNAKGSFLPDPTTYFLPSVPLLEYVLRYFKLAPLDCVSGVQSMTGGYKTARVAIACRAINEIAATGDKWMADATGWLDYRLIDWDLVDPRGDDPPAYSVPQGCLIDPATGTCDVVRTVFESPPLDLPESVATFGLNDVY